MPYAHLGAVAVGGTVGAISRYLVNLACARWLGDHFAFGTLTVNVLGCFLVGLLVPLGTADLPRWNEVVHSALTVGFVGALTTFSSFGIETACFLEDSQPGAAVLNIGSNMVLGLAAVFGGLLLGRWLIG